jgi:hypothetical protein
MVPASQHFLTLPRAFKLTVMLAAKRKKHLSDLDHEARAELLS